ncbi:MAG: hypothetical protein WCF77_03950 [Minisyncoccia bacterium]
MSHNSRRALFYGFFLLFLALGTGIVLFAEGWRVDFPSFRISKVGGIYVRSFPEDATITLNAKPVQNESGFLSYGTLLSDLFPKIYRLTLTAPGYDDWNENVSVAPALVATEKYAVLVPQEGITAASGTTLNFSAQGGGLIVENGNEAISRNGVFVAYGTMITASHDLGAMIFLDTHGIYRLSLAGSSSTVNFSAAFAKGGMNLAQATFLSVDPANNATVIAADATQVLSFDSSRSALASFEKDQSAGTVLPSVAVSPSSVAWALFDVKKNSSKVMIYDRSTGAVTDKSLTLDGRIKKLSWLSDNMLGILTGTQELYSYDIGAKNLKKTADDVLDFSETQDGASLAALEGNSLEIFSLSDPSVYDRFRLPENGNASGIAWYHDGDHLFITYSDHVSFLDLQDASLSNFTTVSAGMSPEYDPETNALYLIDPQGNLLRFDFAK